MSLPKQKPGKKFTYADYKSWPAEERWELINGDAYDMSPSPGTGHQSIVLMLTRKIADYLDSKECRVFIAPLDVRLKEKSEDSEDEILTVVQPDILVVCDSSKIEKTGITGAPDLVIEILSELTAYKDQTGKLALYEKHGVKEYWIVNPGACYVQIYRLTSDGRFSKPDYYNPEDEITSNVLMDFSIMCKDIFVDAL